MKQKTYKSAAKRVVRVTSNGKIIHRNLSAQHLTHGKSKRALRNSNKTSVISLSDKNKLRRLILK